MENLTRRHFMGTGIAAAASLAAGSARAASPNSKVNMAFVGIGQRAGEIAKSFLSTGMVNPVAFCDIDPAQGPKLRKEHPNVPFFKDFRQMFDRMAKDIDAVCVGTPDHTHFPVCMQAAALGKHFYVEKPLAHTFRECELLMAAERKYKVAAQMGNQGHTGDNFYQFKAWTEAGIIKDVTRIDAFMNSPRRWHPWKFDGFQSDGLTPPDIDWDVWTGPAAEKPFSKYLHPGNWRSWFEFGNGAFGDWGPHILDTCHRFLKLGLPTAIEAVNLEGRRKEIFPMASTIRFSFPARDGMPACEVTWRDGVNNRPPLPEEMKGMKLPANGKIIHSKDLVFSGGTHASTLSIVPKDKADAMKSRLPQYKSPETRDHFVNFIKACRGEMECKSSMAVAAPLSQVFLLGVIAQRLGGRLEFDPASKRITNNPAADALLNPPPRKGWEQYHQI